MIEERLAALRAMLKKMGGHAIIIPTEDPHQSEYPPAHWKLREWLSGFTGSAGMLVVTRDQAGLWTDSRYFIQAEEELKGSSIILHKVHDRSAPGHLDWLNQNLSSGEKLLVINELIPYASFKKIGSKLEKKGILLEAINDPFSTIWPERPALPKDKIFEHPLKYAGTPRESKLALVREEMQKIEADHYLITALDEIAWLLNMRSTDVECNPVFIAYMLVSKDACQLFIDKDKLDAETSALLHNSGVRVKSYNAVIDAMHSLDDNDLVMLDKMQTNLALYTSISKARVIHAESPVLHLKAIKSRHELDQIDNCMVLDGVALARAFYWLEKTLEKEPVSEYDFAMKISEYRSQQDGYFGESFHAIVGYSSNGAIVHYRPTKEKSKLIENKGLLLVDCGGQYMNGTTDITRTIALGKATPEQRKNYTLVLKGHIALARAIFPESTTGCQLDILARQFLWNEGLNFTHGTGHGIGYFNNVHEGPQGIAPSPASRAKYHIKEGMVISNEPGYYEEGEYGIRIENLIACQKDSNTGFLTFRTISLMPFDMQLLDTSLLNSEERDWINAYHDEVHARLSPFLDQEHKNWLAHKCQDISV